MLRVCKLQPPFFSQERTRWYLPLTSPSLPAILDLPLSIVLPFRYYPFLFTTEHVSLPISELRVCPRRHIVTSRRKKRKEKRSSSRPRTHPFNLILNSRIRWKRERWSTPNTTRGRRRRAACPSRGTPTLSSPSSGIPSSSCRGCGWWRVSVSHGSRTRDWIVSWLWCGEIVFLACSSGHAVWHSVGMCSLLRVVEDGSLRLVTVVDCCWRYSGSLRKVGRCWYIRSIIGAISRIACV